MVISLLDRKHKASEDAKREFDLEWHRYMEAKQEFDRAWDDFINADPEYAEVATLKLKAAEMKLDIVLRDLRQGEQYV